MNFSCSQYAWDNVYKIVRTRCTEVWTRLIGKANPSHTFQKQRAALLAFFSFLIPEYLGRLPDCGATLPVADVGFLSFYWESPSCMFSRKTLCALIAFILLSSVIPSLHLESVLLTLHGRKKCLPWQKVGYAVNRGIGETFSICVKQECWNSAYTNYRCLTMGLGLKAVCFVCEKAGVHHTLVAEELISLQCSLCAQGMQSVRQLGAWPLRMVTPWLQHRALSCLSPQRCMSPCWWVKATTAGTAYSEAKADSADV